VVKTIYTLHVLNVHCGKIGNIARFLTDLQDFTDFLRYRTRLQQMSFRMMGSGITKNSSVTGQNIQAHPSSFLPISYKWLTPATFMLVYKDLEIYPHTACAISEIYFQIDGELNQIYIFKTDWNSSLSPLVVPGTLSAPSDILLRH